jgi:hypothetical protein
MDRAPARAVSAARHVLHVAHAASAMSAPDDRRALGGGRIDLATVTGLRIMIVRCRGRGARRRAADRTRSGRGRGRGRDNIDHARASCPTRKRPF